MAPVNNTLLFTQVNLLSVYYNCNYTIVSCLNFITGRKNVGHLTYHTLFELFFFKLPQPESVTHGIMQGFSAKLSWALVIGERQIINMYKVHRPLISYGECVVPRGYSASPRNTSGIPRTPARPCWPSTTDTVKS